MDIYQCLKLISCQGFFNKLSKNNMGASWGGHLIPPMPPMLFFSKKQKLPFESNTHHPLPITSPTHPLPTTPPPHPHHHHHPPTQPPHQPPPHHHPSKEPSNHPPQRKSGALMPDISWAPPHSLPIR